MNIQFKIGDKIICRRKCPSPRARREITEKRRTGYSWRYPDFPKTGEHLTENSTDPFLIRGWEKVKNNAIQFEVGDKIICREKHSFGITREITEKRETGYTWCYPDDPVQGTRRDMGDWWTENSTDPFLVIGWEKIE